MQRYLRFAAMATICTLLAACGGGGGGGGDGGTVSASGDWSSVALAGNDLAGFQRTVPASMGALEAN